MSSFESMSATLSKVYWGLHSKPMYHRNYGCERWIYSYFRTINLNQTGAAAFQRQLYFCMLGQALFLKAQVEGWRANNIWGLLLWQYNEVRTYFVNVRYKIVSRMNDASQSFMI